MGNQRLAEILAIGDELLSGETVDTNSSYLDGVLEGVGITVVRHLSVGDDVDRIAEGFDLAARRAKWVFSTGGLGPTADDLTMEGLAKALGVGLVRDDPTLQSIKQRFEAFGRPMTPNNERQAMVPEVGEVIDNESGTAPSFTAKLHNAVVFLMPGVPREVRWLMRHRILPRLSIAEGPILRRTLKVIGLGESALEDAIQEIVRRHPELVFGYRTLGVENHIKLRARGDDRQAGMDAMDTAEKELRAVLGDRIYGDASADLPSLVGRMLLERGETVALAESCTGGLTTKLLTDAAGASRYVVGCVVSYSRESKSTLLGVSSESLQCEGAVSEKIAKEMADGAQKRFGSTWGLSVTGVAGPSGGSEGTPVGTVWLALAGRGGAEAKRVRFPGDREFVRGAAACSLLDFFRRRLLRED